jgi:hypothetical protein
MMFYNGQVVVCINEIDGIMEGMICRISRNNHFPLRNAVRDSENDLLIITSTVPSAMAEDYFKSGIFGPYPLFSGTRVYMTQQQAENYFMGEYEWGVNRRRLSRVESVIGDPQSPE